MEFKECECSCPRCKSMCEIVPCIPSPEEAQKISDEGSGYKLVERAEEIEEDDGFHYIHFLSCGTEKEDGYVGDQINYGNCKFRTEEGLCELHDSGYKPIEARLCSCGLSNEENIKVHRYVIELWKSDEAQQILLEWRKKWWL